MWPSAEDFAKDAPYRLSPTVDILLHIEQESDLEKEDSVQEGSEQFYPQQDESPPADLHPPRITIGLCRASNVIRT